MAGVNPVIGNPGQNHSVLFVFSLPWKLFHNWLTKAQKLASLIQP